MVLMTTPTSELYATFAQAGRVHTGALMLVGDTWPESTPIWTCSHRHREVEKAQHCAEEEMARRQAVE